MAFTLLLIHSVSLAPISVSPLPPFPISLFLTLACTLYSPYISSRVPITSRKTPFSGSSTVGISTESLIG